MRTGDIVKEGAFDGDVRRAVNAALQTASGSIPASATAAGVAGQTAYESGFFYVCVATNVWQRVAIATWP
jgi:hypothetical protein